LTIRGIAGPASPDPSDAACDLAAERATAVLVRLLPFLELTTTDQ
jgi:hypothetical protein